MFSKKGFFFSIMLLSNLFILANNVYGVQAAWDAYPELGLIMKITYISNCIAVRNNSFRNNSEICFKEKGNKKFRMYK